MQYSYNINYTDAILRILPNMQLLSHFNHYVIRLWWSQPGSAGGWPLSAHFRFLPKKGLQPEGELAEGPGHGGGKEGSFSLSSQGPGSLPPGAALVPGCWSKGCSGKEAGYSAGQHRRRIKEAQAYPQAFVSPPGQGMLGCSIELKIYSLWLSSGSCNPLL